MLDYTPYLHLSLNGSLEENRNWTVLDNKAADLARNLIANIPAGGDLTGFYPDPQIAAGVVGDNEISTVSWSKLTGIPPGVTAPAIWTDDGTLLRPVNSPRQLALDVNGAYYIGSVPGAPVQLTKLVDDKARLLGKAGVQLTHDTQPVADFAFPQGMQIYGGIVFNGPPMQTLGSIGYQNGHFQGYNGSAWVNLDDAGGGGGTSLWADDPIYEFLKPANFDRGIFLQSGKEIQWADPDGSVGRSTGIKADDNLLFLSGGAAGIFFRSDDMGTNFAQLNATGLGIMSGDLITGGVQFDLYRGSPTDGAVQWNAGVGLQVYSGGTWQTLSTGGGGGTNYWADDTTNSILSPIATRSVAMPIGQSLLFGNTTSGFLCRVMSGSGGTMTLMTNGTLSAEVGGVSRMSIAANAPPYFWGGIRIDATQYPVTAGHIDYSGGRFRGYNGSAWVFLDVQAGGSNGSLGTQNYITATATITTGNQDNIITASAADIDVTLPAWNTALGGQTFRFYRSDGQQARIVRLVPGAGDTIDGVATTLQVAVGESITLMALTTITSSCRWVTVANQNWKSGRLGTLNYIQPTDTFRTIYVVGTTNVAQFVLANQTNKLRLKTYSPSQVSEISVNKTDTDTQDDSSKSSWALTLDPAAAGPFSIARKPGAGAWTTPLQLDSVGKLIIPGPTSGTDQAALLFGSRTIKQRLLCLATGDYGYLSFNASWNGSTWAQDDNTKASWFSRFAISEDNWAIQRAAPAGQPAPLLTIDSAGALHLQATTATGKGHFFTSPGLPVTFLTSNMYLAIPGGAWTQEDATKPGWALNLRGDTDSFNVTRFPPGSTTGTYLLTLDSGGVLTVPGSTTTGDSFTYGTRTAKGRLWHAPANDAVYWSFNRAGAGTQDDATSPGWWMRLAGTGNDNLIVARQPAGGGTSATLLTLDNAGILQLSGVAYRIANGAQLSSWTGDVGVKTDLICNNGQASSTTRPLWLIRLDCGTSDSIQFQRQAPSGGAYTSTVVSAGNGDFQISGATATKASGTTWANPSDIRMKRDIADYGTGLSAITQLRPISFKYNGMFGGIDDDRLCYGFVADEVESVMPDCVGTRDWTPPNPDGEEQMAPVPIKTLDQSNIILALVNAVKELATKVATLEARNA